MAKSEVAASGHAPELNVIEARQGRSGRPIVWVLTISTGLVVIAFAVIWIVHIPGFSRPGAQTQVSGAGAHSQLAPAQQTSSSNSPPAQQ